jgi:hypothetical protein
MESQLLERDIDEGFSCDSFEEQSSPCEDFENQTYEEDLKEEQLDDWIEAFHERKWVIDDLFLEFQRNPSHELGVEISKKIEENNAFLNLIEEKESMATTQSGKIGGISLQGHFSGKSQFGKLGSGTFRNHFEASYDIFGA